MSSQKIGDMPDDVGNYIQNFLRPDLIKEKQKKLIKRSHKLIKWVEYCECSCCCDCPRPDVIQQLDNYKDSEVFFVTCNYDFKRCGFKDFNKAFIMWYRTASGEFSDNLPLSEYYPEMEHDIDRMYCMIGTANDDFNFWRYDGVPDWNATFLSMTKCDLIRNKYNYLKSIKN